MESRKRSDVWMSFEQLPNSKAKCNFCSQLISYKGGSTFNLTRHLKSKHLSTFIVPSSVSPTRKNTSASACEEDTGEPSTSTATLTQSHQAQNVINETEIGPPKKKQKTIGTFFYKQMSNKKKNDINASLVKTIAKNYLSFRLVESDVFKEFVKELNPAYQLPCRKTISKVLVPQYYNLKREALLNIIESAEAVCLTTDGWTSVTNESYLAVTAHYVFNNQMTSNLLDCYRYTDSHTAANLCDELLRIAQEWKITEKITVVVSDNAANIVAAIRRTGWKHIPCFAHTINLVVQSSLATIQHIREKVKSIVDFFRRSPQATEKLKQMQKQLGAPELKIKQDVVTRWNSTYDMFQRILDIKEALMSVIAINYPNIDNLTSDDISNLEKCCEILKIFKDVTEEISSEKEVTASKVILFSSSLITYCKKMLIEHSDMPEMCKELTGSLIASLQKRFHNIEQNKIFADATLLDPRFKKYGFSDKTAYEAAKQSCITCVTSMSSRNKHSLPGQENDDKPEEVSAKPTKPSSLWDNFDSAVSKIVSNPNPVAAGIIEVEKYLDEPLLARQSDPFKWWEERKKIYPNLYELMKKRLSIVATSVPSERIFSKAGQTLTEKRSNLQGEKVSMLLFLNANF